MGAALANARWAELSMDWFPLDCSMRIFFTEPSRLMVKVTTDLARRAERTAGSISKRFQLLPILRRTASTYQPSRVAKSPPPWLCIFTPLAAEPAALPYPVARLGLPPRSDLTTLSGV